MKEREYINSFFVEFYDEKDKYSTCFVNAKDILGVEDVFYACHPECIIDHVYVRCF